MSAPVLVTGGAGYVGASAVRALAAAGRRVVVLDDLSTGTRAHLRWGTFVEGDAGDPALVGRVCREHGVGAVLHFAAKTSVEASVGDPDGYFRANVVTTSHLVRAARDAGVRAIVFSSSAAVYGTPRALPIPEDHPLEPESPYGATKAEAERVLAEGGVPAACLRYFNAAGAEPDAGLCERHDPETHLIPRALDAAARGSTLRVFGGDWPTADGTCVRDYVHVADLATAHLAALAHLERGGRGGAWNLGTGRGASVREVVGAVERATGRPVRVEVVPRRRGDPVALVADPRRAERELGWRATARSTLDAIVADAFTGWRTVAAETAAAGGGPRP